jgi:hypothetical protein
MDLWGINHIQTSAVKVTEPPEVRWLAHGQIVDEQQSQDSNSGLSDTLCVRITQEHP